MHFLRTPRHCPTLLSVEHGRARRSTSCPCLNVEQDLGKVRFPKLNSVSWVGIKGTSPFLGFLFHHSSSASRKVKLLCASQLLFFSPVEKLNISQQREHVILSQQQITSRQQELPWQAYYLEFNEKNQFRHQAKCYLAVLSRSLCPKPSQEREPVL